MNGLGQEYESIKTSIEGSIDGTQATFYEDIVLRLTAFDQCLESYSLGSRVPPHMAFQAEKPDVPHAQYNNNYRGNNNQS